MKKILLSFIFISFAIITFAQNITFENDTSIQVFTSSVAIPFDIDGHTIIHNNTNADIDITWTRVVNEKPQNWGSAICIGTLCYAPTKDTGETTVPANGIIDLYFHAYPGETSGYINANVNITNTTTGELYGLGHYEFTVESAVANGEISNEETFTLFPNPTNGHLNIKASFDLDHYEIYNLIGSLIQRVEGINSSDISNLPNGIYLVKAYNKALDFTTVKLLKN